MRLTPIWTVLGGLLALATVIDPASMFGLNAYCREPGLEGAVGCASLGTGITALLSVPFLNLALRQLVTTNASDSSLERDIESAATRPDADFVLNQNGFHRIEFGDRDFIAAPVGLSPLTFADG